MADLSEFRPTFNQIHEAFVSGKPVPITLSKDNSRIIQEKVKKIPKVKAKKNNKNKKDNINLAWPR